MRIILFVFTLILYQNVFSQDKIWMKTGEIIEVRVIEVNKKEIKYQFKDSSPESVVFAIPTESVTSVHFSNGHVESLEKFRYEVADKSKYHLIEYNPADLVFRNISLNYEFYPTKDRTYSLLLPVRIGIPTQVTHYSKKNVFESGIGLIFYPYRGVRLNIFTGFESVYQYKETKTFYSGNEQISHSQYAGFYITNGMRFNLAKHLGFCYSFSGGMNFFLTASGSDLIGKMNISMFWRL